MLLNNDEASAPKLNLFSAISSKISITVLKLVTTNFNASAQQLRHVLCLMILIHCFVCLLNTLIKKLFFFYELLTKQ